MSEFTGAIHSLCAMWPKLPLEELQSLADDINEHGLQNPIIIAASGDLIDGRNRLDACDMADVEPTFIIRDDLDTDEKVAAFIGSANAERRHLTTGQQAAGRALMLIAQGKRKDGRWAYGTFAGSRESTTETAALRQCGAVADWTELLPRVLAGDIALDDAYRQAKAVQEVEQAEELAAKRAEKAAREQAKRDAEQLADLRTNRTDLAEAVDNGAISLTDALTIRSTELAKEQKRIADELGWIKKLCERLYEATSGTGTITHPNNRRVLIDGWHNHPEFQHPINKNFNADDIRTAGKQLIELADEWDTE